MEPSMMCPRPPRLPIVTLALVLAVLAPPGRAAEQRGDLTGAWRLDRAASDQTGGPPAEAGESRGHPPGGHGGGHGGGYGGHGGGMRPPGGHEGGEGGDADREKMKERMEQVRALLEPMERLTITQDGDVVTVVDGEGRVEKLVPNGQKETHLVGNTQAELKSRWEDGRLVSDMALVAGVKFRRTVWAESASDGVRRLTIEFKPQGGMGEGRPPVKRVYDLIE